MADISLEDLKKIEDAVPALGAFIAEMEAAGRVMVANEEIAKKFGAAFAKDIIEKLGDGAKALKDFSNIIGSNLSSAFNEVKAGMGDLLKSSKMAEGGMASLGLQTALAFEPSLGLLPKGIADLGALGQAGYDAGSKISTAFDGMSSIIPEGAAKKWFDEMADGTDRVYGLQRSIIGLAAAQGNLNSVIDEGGNKFKDLNQAYFDQVNLAYTSAVATGQTVKSMMDLTKTIGNIPGSLTEAVVVGETSMNQLTATSKLATGFMISQEKVGSTLSDMYTDMGISGEGAFNSLANIYDKAGDSKLRFETFSDTVLNIAKSFKMLGDNTDAATEVVRAFDEAFKDSDISPAAMTQVINSLTAGVEKMDRGKQAFISSQTGGPGGLAGAFQMEYAMQTGNMDEVVKKTMTAMQAQFGGEILTLKDAAENPALSGEFMKQVKYLTDVAGVAGNDREAYRMLEAMQSGATDMLTPGVDEGPQALKDAVDRGTSIQEQQKSVLMTIHQDTERLKYIQSDIMRMASESGINPLLSGGADLSQRMENATTKGATRGLSIMAAPDNNLVSLDKGESANELITDIGESSLLGKMIGFINKNIMPNDDGNDVNAGFSSGIQPAAGAVPEINRPVPAEAKGSGTKGERQRIELTTQPLEVIVKFEEPFNQKVRGIVNSQIGSWEQAKIIGGVTGDSSPRGR